ncbi:inositol polyphosphate 5-phosphatase K [Cimex lectularius]|uniref:Inositol polyphosphate-related phosphatase domain-containing protein n=1 Tax=Cimex lectularius TaxID=79782 RepID=A0A8I6RIV1_CIMLE|nr:inositol polyphosphate 5-phosphatase K [Cimex lectularius]
MHIVAIFVASELIIGVLSAAVTGKEIKVHVGTWNVDAKGPRDNVDELIGLKPSSQPNDLILLGFQEMVSLSLTGAFKKAIQGEKWTGDLENKFKNKNYIKVEARTMFGIGSYVYLLNTHQDSLDKSSVKVEEVKTGLLGKVGNKGGIVTSFKLFGKGFTTISAHFPAHYEQNEKRISVYKRILNATKGLTNDFMFWLGDLNFRVDKEREDIVKKINENKTSELLVHDQLKECQKNGTAFKDWNEAEITFKPTFKYEKESDTYSDKRRPSWTDRVLYKSETQQTITSKKYQRLEHKYSDHRPVTAEFTIKL